MSGLLTRRKALLAGAASLALPRRARAFAHGGGNRTPYLGAIATRPTISNAINTTFKYLMSRTRHLCFTSVTSVQLVLPCFIVAQTPGTESGWGANSAVTASIEYPAGTFSQVTFSGATTGTVTNGTYLVSDPCTVTIPSGAYFFVRWWCSNAAGIGYVGLNNGTNFIDTVNGEATVFSATSIPDQTMSGTITSTAQQMSGPVAVIGQTSNPAVMLIGDSRCVGIYDTVSTSGNQQTLLGEVSRWVGQSFAFSNFGSPGAQLANWLANNTQQLALSKYFSHVICQYAINDFGAGGKTAQQQIANVEAMAALFQGKPVFQTTCVITSTSTDQFETTTNQTPQSDNAAIQAFNAALRAGSVSGLAGFFDTDAAVESPALSGKWIVNGTAYYATADGTHEVQAGNLLIAAALASQAATAIHF